MGSIVIELQEEAIRNDFDILNLLRKAYLIARKLNLSDFENWVKNELNGYKELNQLPDYRRVSGDVKGFNPILGWRPVVLVSDNIAVQPILDSIPSLYDAYRNANNKQLVLPFGAELNKFLSSSCGFQTNYGMFIGANQVYEIIEKVRNTILDWAITLEKNGILGEELRFTDKEKEVAESNQVINNYVNNFYSSAERIQIQQNTNKTRQRQS